MLAFAVVLSLVKIVDMPYGGSVTAASMLPIILIAYRYGTGWGLFSGFTASLLMLVTGMSSLSYATSGMAAFAIIMLDYIIAFTAMGLGGVFRKLFKSQSAGLAAGSVLVSLIRYICHVISGCTVWMGVSIPDTDGLIYSLGYNAVYMVPEAIITVAAAAAIGSLLDFTKPSIVPVVEVSGARESRSIGALFLLIAAAVDALFLFSSTQVENAEGDVVFSITGLSGANWTLIAVVTVGALVAYFLPLAAKAFGVIATAVVYSLAELLTANLAGREYDFMLVLGLAAACLVLAVVLWKKYSAAAFITGVSAAALYAMNVLTSGDALVIYDYIIIAVALVFGVVASAAISAYFKKRAEVK